MLYLSGEQGWGNAKTQICCWVILGNVQGPRAESTLHSHEAKSELGTGMFYSLGTVEVLQHRWPWPLSSRPRAPGKHLSLRVSGPSCFSVVIVHVASSSMCMGSMTIHLASLHLYYLCHPKQVLLLPGTEVLRGAAWGVWPTFLFQRLGSLDVGIGLFLLK